MNPHTFKHSRRQWLASLGALGAGVTGSALAGPSVSAYSGVGPTSAPWTALPLHPEQEIPAAVTPGTRYHYVTGIEMQTGNSGFLFGTSFG